MKLFLATALLLGLSATAAMAAGERCSGKSCLDWPIVNETLSSKDTGDGTVRPVQGPAPVIENADDVPAAAGE